MYKLGMLLIALWVNWSQATPEAEAFRSVLKATAKTTEGKAAVKRAERLLYIHRIPEEIKELTPILTIIVTQEIKLKWTF